MFGNRHRRGGGGGHVGVMLLAFQLLSLGFDHIPPVTLLTILAQVAIFLGFVPDLHPTYQTYKYCIRAESVWFRKEWWRLLPSTFMHADDMHLYYNMVSFLWKGRRLERKFGAPYFAFLIAVFAVLTNILIVALAVGIEEKMGFHGFNLMHQCAIGFSGVVFALKVLCNHYFAEGDQWIMGWIPVPSRLACWAELVLIQVMVPHASFVGHLAGILVGLAYVHGPLRPIMNSIFPPERNYEYERESESREGWSFPWSRGGGRPGRTYGSGTWGEGRGYGASRGRSDFYRPDYGDQNAANGYDEYTGGLSEEEQIRRAMDASLRYRTQPSAPPAHQNLGFEGLVD